MKQTNGGIFFTLVMRARADALQKSEDPRASQTAKSAE